MRRGEVEIHYCKVLIHEMVEYHLKENGVYDKPKAITKTMKWVILKKPKEEIKWNEKTQLLPIKKEKELKWTKIK